MTCISALSLQTCVPHEDTGVSVPVRTHRALLSWLVKCCGLKEGLQPISQRQMPRPLSQSCSLVQCRPHLHSPTWLGGGGEKVGLPVCKSVVALTVGCGLHLTSTFLRTQRILPCCHHLGHTQVPTGAWHCGLGLLGRQGCATMECSDPGTQQLIAGARPR